MLCMTKKSHTMSDYNQTTHVGNNAPQSDGVIVPNAPDVEYEWILDENLLRDEGIIYGLTDSDVARKTDVINQYYNIQIEALQARADALQEQADRIVGAISQSGEKINALQEKLAQLSSTAYFSAHQFFRTLLGVLAYGLACGFNYWAVLEWAGPLWQASAAVTAGVYIFGALSLFNTQSILYQKDEEQIPVRRERWKIVVEEFVVPLAATLFIITWRAKPATIEQTAAFGLLLYLVFLFAGKGLMSSLLQLKADVVVVYNDMLKNKWRRSQIRQLTTGIDEKKNEIKQQEAELAEVYGQLEEKEKSIKAMQATKFTKIAYFLSEYELAQSARNYMTNEQIVLMGMHKKSS